jgi:hypothetical protein
MSALRLWEYERTRFLHFVEIQEEDLVGDGSPKGWPLLNLTNIQGVQIYHRLNRR